MIVLAKRTTVFVDAVGLARQAARACERVLVEATARSVEAHFVVTGGHIGTAILGELDRPATDINWQCVHVWWGDERFLPDGDPERNVTQAGEAFLNRSGIPASHIHAIPGRSAAVPDAAAAAVAYAAELDRHGPPRFDLVLLSLGPDGHLASLFPGRPEVDATGMTVPVVNAPKPPPERVSLTLSRLLAADRIWLLVVGEGKRDALEQAMADAVRPRTKTPAAAVLQCPRTRLFVDADAWPATATKTSAAAPRSQ